jgi:tripartite-type tricarboxylate transporter receptor subunit TctC
MTNVSLMKPAGIIAVALATLSCNAQAQAWPAKPIRTIMTVAGGLDIVARIIAQGVGEAVGQPVIVEAQSGAGGAVGADMVMRAAPDGHTLMLAGPQTLIVRRFLVKNTPYDVQKDFTPIGQVSETTSIIVTSPTLPVTSLRELLDYAKKNPNKVYYGTSGIGTSHHFSAESISQLTGVQWVHVPYKGGPQVITDLMSGQTQVGFSILATMMPFVHATDKIRIVAVNSDRRYPTIPDLPTVGEIIPGYERPPSWNAYFGPAGLPQPIVRRLNTEMTRIISQPAVRTKLQDIGFLPQAGTPEELSEMIRRDVAAVGRSVQQLGLKAE